MAQNTPQNPEKNTFGTQSVSPQEKTSRVHGVFDNVATQYDVMNDVMSGGMHRLWKDRFMRMIRPKPHHTCLDVAGGTGDIAFRIYKKTGFKADITVCDLTPAMLDVGENRAIDKGWLNAFEWVAGNAESLPFADNTYDLYTIAFGLRNVTHIDTALKEAHRVLKPGGRFYCLEFSRVDTPILSQIYDAYSQHVIPRMGQAIANDRDSYQYLVDSIRAFPSQRQLQHRIRDAGFSHSHYTNMTFGVVSVHCGVKTV